MHSILRQLSIRRVACVLALCLSATPALAQNAIELLKVSGDDQNTVPNTALSAPLVTQLQPDSQFDPNTPVAVVWQVVSGAATIVESGSSSFVQQVTLAVGAAGAIPPPPTQIHILAGATPGNVLVRATCTVCESFVAKNPGVQFQQDFTATVSQAVTPVLQIVSGDGQNGGAYLPATAPLVVQLTVNGAPVANQTVTWNVAGGQATLASTTTQTDINGQTSNTFTYGAAGDVVIGASAGGVQVRFHAAAHAQVAQLVSGDHQSGAVGTAGDAPLMIKVTANGQPVANQSVAWTVASGASVAFGSPLESHPPNFTTSSTDANGVASVTFAYIAAGTATISANAGNGSNVVNFTATGFAPTIVTASGNNQSGPVNSTLQPFVVQIGQPAATASVRSSHTNGLGGVPVNWSVVQGGGTLASAQTLTDANGSSSNTLKLGPNAGSNVVQATVQGTTVTFTATATAGAPPGSQLSITGGGAQNLLPLTPSAPMIVKLVDAQGQPVSGINIQWTETGATGTLAHSETATDANGQAQNVLTVVLPGAYSVTAKVADSPGIPAVTFSFNNGVANLSGLTPAQIAVAHAIDVACPALFVMNSGNPDSLSNPQKDFLGRCSEVVVRTATNPAQVPAALDAMLNNKSLPQRNLAQGVQMGQYGNLNTRLTELRQGISGLSLGGLGIVQDGRSLPLATFADTFRKDPNTNNEVGADFARWGFFATGQIQRGGFSAMNEQPGFDFHNASLTAGIDYRFNTDFVAGVALGYNNNHSSLDENAGKVDIDGYSLDGYFTWYRGDFYIEGSATLGWLNYDLRRHINYQIDSLADSGGLTTIDQTASASPDGNQNSLSLSFGRDFNRQAWTFSPYLRGVYTHLSLDGFSETMSNPGAPGAGLGTLVEGRSLSSLLGVLGARASFTHSYDWGVLVPNALLEWNHEFRNDAQTVITRFLADPTQTPVVLTDVPPDSNYLNIGIGLNAVLPQGRSGFIYFEHMAGYAGAHENRLSIGIRIEF